MFLQRTRAGFASQHPRGSLQSSLELSSRGSGAIFWNPSASDTHAVYLHIPSKTLKIKIQVLQTTKRWKKKKKGKFAHKKNNRISVRNYRNHFCNYLITYYRVNEGHFMAKKKSQFLLKDTK